HKFFFDLLDFPLLFFREYFGIPAPIAERRVGHRPVNVYQEVERDAVPGKVGSPRFLGQRKRAAAEGGIDYAVYDAFHILNLAAREIQVHLGISSVLRQFHGLLRQLHGLGGQQRRYQKQNQNNREKSSHQFLLLS